MGKVRLLKPTLTTVPFRTTPLPPKQADAHYGTAEHRAWAAEVIKRARGKCQDANCIAKHYPGQRLFADHIVELRDGGAPFDVTNGMARCGSSHTRKTIAERAKRAKNRP